MKIREKIICMRHFGVMALFLTVAIDFLYNLCYNIYSKRVSTYRREQADVLVGFFL